MKSPFTGGEATPHRETRTMEFRKESFHVLFVQGYWGAVYG
jgi:hypothetical protein